MLSLSVDASAKLVRRPKFIVRNFVWISEADIAFQKGYKQTFTSGVFEIYDISTKNPPNYSLIDSTQNPTQWKFFELELVKVVDKAVKQQSMNELSVHIVSSISLNIFL